MENVASSSHTQSPQIETTSAVNPKKPVSDVIVDYLVNEGVDTVFGIPGGATIPLHASIERSPHLRFVLAKHEGGAAFMADCYARVSGKLGVCCATTGPGATNLMTGVAAAYADSVAMLVLTGMNPTDAWALGDFQESTAFGVDTVAMFKHITKMSEVVVTEKQVQPILRRALNIAQSGRPGPVHLAIPRDILSRAISPDVWLPTTYKPRPPSASSHDITAVAEVLASARRPVFIVGSGVGPDAAADIAFVSEKCAIPIVCSPRAKSLFSHYYASFYLGTMGIAACPVVDCFLGDAQCDAVIAIGAGMGSYATNSWDPLLRQNGPMVQVNIDAGEIGKTYPADIGIVSDAATFAAALRRAVEGQDQETIEAQRTERLEWLRPYLALPKWPFAADADRPVPEGPAPDQIVRAVDRALPYGGILMADSSSMLLWATHHFPETQGRRFIGVWGSASMGHVTAGAVGAKLAAGDRAVVALVGDGCFLMNGTEIATAAELGLPIVWIVSANGQLGMIHYEQRASGLTQSSELPSLDYTKMAEGLGARGIRCDDTSELPIHIARGLRDDGPTVIQVNVNPVPSPPLGRKKAGGARWKEYVASI